MRKMSYWAKYHPRTARIIITIAEINLYVLSVTLGILLLQAHILLHQKFAGLALLFILSAVIFYPYKSNPEKKYVLRKSLEFTLGLGIFMMGCFIVNRDKINSWNSFTPLQGHSVSFTETESKVTPVKKTLTKKQMRKEVKAWHKQERKKNHKLSWLWITLTILGGIALLCLVAALACGLGCEGSITGAWLVGILGTALVVFVMVKLIKSISKHKKADNKTAKIKRKHYSDDLPMDTGKLSF